MENSVSPNPSANAQAKPEVLMLVVAKPTYRESYLTRQSFICSTVALSDGVTNEFNSSIVVLQLEEFVAGCNVNLVSLLDNI